MLASLHSARVHDPFAGFDALLRDLDRWSRAGRSSGSSSVTVTADADGWTVWVPLPGVTPSMVDLQVNQHNLRLKVTDAAEALPEGFRRVHQERRRPPVDATWRLDESVDLDAITAEMARGLLRVRLPRRAAPKSRSIPVTAGQP